ncbi:MAG: hypothetical protein ABI806_28710 [Candidatus Solibacter sp.]
MCPIAAAALDVHGYDHVGAERADQARVIADDLLTAPLPDHFLGIEGVAVVDGACEVLFGAVAAVRGKQFRCAQHPHVME